MKITHKQALEEPQLRQEYLDELVEAGGGKPDFVHSYKYVSDKEMKIILRDNGRAIPENEILPSGTTIPFKNKMGNNSIVYFPENNFSPAVKFIYNPGYPSSDFEIVNRTEVMNHETEHARHFKYGFPDMPLERFDFNNNLESLLFIFISEFLAHASHIQALGLTKPQSDYPKKYQQFLIKEAKDYVSNAARIFKTGKVNPSILEYIQKNFSELRFNAL